MAWRAKFWQIFTFPVCHVLCTVTVSWWFNYFKFQQLLQTISYGPDKLFFANLSQCVTLNFELQAWAKCETHLCLVIQIPSINESYEPDKFLSHLTLKCNIAKLSLLVAQSRMLVNQNSNRLQQHKNVHKWAICTLRNGTERNETEREATYRGN